jgi:hypothetical protein
MNLDCRVSSLRLSGLEANRFIFNGKGKLKGYLGLLFFCLWETDLTGFG